MKNKDNHKALVSTVRAPYPSVPDEKTLENIEDRCKEFIRLDDAPIKPGEYTDMYFDPK